MIFSETVKFGHVTFFWNGNRSGYFNPNLEKYEEIPSDTGIPFNEQPKMKAVEVAEKAKDAILSGKFDQVLGKMRCSSVNHVDKHSVVTARNCRL